MKGKGNSRYLKSVGDFPTQYPTYEALAAALAEGTLPIDLNSINPEGWAQQGTPLDKEHLLTDSAAALMGLGPEASPNEMLAALANRITYGTADLTPGTSLLPTGTVYFVYE